MFEFLKSHAGRFVCGLAVMCALVTIPHFLNWLAATFALAWSVHELREAFRIVEAAEQSNGDAGEDADRFAA